MTRSFVLGFGLVVASAAVAAAQAPTEQERAACRSDAISFCRSHAGKPQEMNTCLRQNKARLSDACRAVIEKRGG